MTVSTSEKGIFKGLTAGQVCFGGFSLFCLALILRNSEIAMEYIHRGLLLCARTVIPSLFPFMVLSELLVMGELGKTLLSVVSRPIRKCMALSKAGGNAVLLGMLCGFPVGARCALLSYERGFMSKEECERTLSCCNNPSSAFFISAVGISLWGNRSFGIVLYLTTLLTALFTGILFARQARKRTIEKTEINPSPPSLQMKNAGLFTNAIRSATEGILTVCAYVVFFSALTGVLDTMLGELHIPDALGAWISALFEISGGMSRAAAIPNRTIAALLCAFGAGWSGLSMHCQLLALCDKKGLRLRSYFCGKLLQSVLCTLLMAIILFFHPSLLLPLQDAPIQPLWYLWF